MNTVDFVFNSYVVDEMVNAYKKNLNEGRQVNRNFLVDFIQGKNIGFNAEQKAQWKNKFFDKYPELFVKGEVITIEPR